jgi:hypothetical protein
MCVMVTGHGSLVIPPARNNYGQKSPANTTGDPHFNQVFHSLVLSPSGHLSFSFQRMTPLMLMYGVPLCVTVHSIMIHVVCHLPTVPLLRLCTACHAVHHRDRLIFPNGVRCVHLCDQQYLRGLRGRAAWYVSVCGQAARCRGGKWGSGREAAWQSSLGERWLGHSLTHTYSSLINPHSPIRSRIRPLVPISTQRSFSLPHAGTMCWRSMPLVLRRLLPRVLYLLGYHAAHWQPAQRSQLQWVCLKHSDTPGRIQNLQHPQPVK